LGWVHHPIHQQKTRHAHSWCETTPDSWQQTVTIQ
jgi:hypothetical protein